MTQVGQLRKESKRPSPIIRCIPIEIPLSEFGGGTGFGSGGVWDEVLVGVYGKTLQQLQTVMTGKPYNNWSSPSDSVEVFIADLNDLEWPKAIMFADRGKPIIVLPCRIGEATDDAEWQYALVCAFRKASHALCHYDQPFAGKNFESWRWFNEASGLDGVYPRPGKLIHGGVWTGLV